METIPFLVDRCAMTLSRNEMRKYICRIPVVRAMKSRAHLIHIKHTLISNIIISVVQHYVVLIIWSELVLRLCSKDELPAKICRSYYFLFELILMVSIAVFFSTLKGQFTQRSGGAQRALFVMSDDKNLMFFFVYLFLVLLL